MKIVLVTGLSLSLLFAQTSASACPAHHGASHQCSPAQCEEKSKEQAKDKTESTDKDQAQAPPSDQPAPKKE